MVKTLISIVGTTAIGKTAMSIRVAEHFNTEIVSCDSRQFYKEMSIGTAVPSKEELGKIKHHFIQNISVEQNYSVGDYERDAIKKLDSLFQTNDVVVLVGGSGLYEKAVIKGLDDFPEIPSIYREKLKQELAEKGLEFLSEELKQVDPEYYQMVDLNNQQRVIRALEIYRATDNPFSSYRKQNQKKRNFNTIRVGLTLERNEIYNRINRRVDLMLEQGLLEEVKQLYSKKQLNALQTVGYKELFSYLEDNISLEFAVEEIKKNTRRFAKRQLTWYRNDDSIHWFKANEHQKIIHFLRNLFAA